MERRIRRISNEFMNIQKTTSSRIIFVGLFQLIFFSLTQLQIITSMKRFLDVSDDKKVKIQKTLLPWKSFKPAELMLAKPFKQ